MSKRKPAPRHATPRKKTNARPVRRRLDARPDTLDFRDRMFEPTLIEVPTSRPLDDYRAAKVPILDQGRRARAPASASPP